MTKCVGIFAALIALAALGVAQTTEPIESKPRTVAVRGLGIVMTTPDQVRMNVQVNTRAESPSGAMREASKRTGEILAILETFGVESKYIQTSRVTVTAILDYEKRIQPPPIVGYTGSNSFSVLFKGKLMENVGNFLDQAVTAGASSFGGLMYESSTQRELEREALKKAASDAQKRAEVLAQELGASVARVKSISETVGGGPVPLRHDLVRMESATAAPVMVGELTISASVDVVFELK
jgi:uncharacterized protein YggE